MLATVKRPSRFDAIVRPWAGWLVTALAAGLLIAWIVSLPRADRFAACARVDRWCVSADRRPRGHQSRRGGAVVRGRIDRGGVRPGAGASQERLRRVRARRHSVARADRGRVRRQHRTLQAVRVGQRLLDVPALRLPHRDAGILARRAARRISISSRSIAGWAACSISSSAIRASASSSGKAAVT